MGFYRVTQTKHDARLDDLLSNFAGIAVESVADTQKWQFKADVANRGKWCDVGLWKYSQHPNYAGEIMTWTGVTALALPSIMRHKLATGPNRAILSAGALASPIFLSALLYGQASGSISDAKASMDKRYGLNADYVRYRDTTPLIFPAF